VLRLRVPEPSPQPTNQPQLTAMLWLKTPLTCDNVTAAIHRKTRTGLLKRVPRV
jgi:hypothetical protein